MRRRQFFAGVRTTSLATLASRVLGMLRDMATGALFGLAAGGILDALVLAFRIPNLFRRLFGEGALAASYVPVLAAELEAEPRRAWQLASVTLTWLTIVLLALLIAAEATLAGVGYSAGDRENLRLVVGLAATLMPYMLLICVTAQLAATLHTLGHFAMPALAPVVLNIFWLAGVWIVAPAISTDKVTQVYTLAVCLVIAGVAQLVMQIPPLRAHGFRFDYNWATSRAAFWRVVGAMLPMMFGLAVTQMNTLVDSLLAWGLAATPERGETIAWLPGKVAYPLQQGAVAAVYYGERLYQFPVGVLGVAIATVIFPLLSRHAARGRRRRLGADLTLGMRMVLLLALPASLGLVLLALPVARLLFEHGAFTADDARRAARMIACYGAGSWAYCGLPVLVRGFYASGDRATPVRWGAILVGLNLLLNLALIWPLGEVALGISTTIAASTQVVILAVVFSRRASRLQWPALARTAGVALLATAVMGAACWATQLLLPPAAVGLLGRAVAVCVPLAVSAAVYFAVVAAIGRSELSLLGRSR